MRSDIIKKGFERAPHRSLLRATGSIESEADWDKPFIAICNSYTDCIPGHAHLNEVGMLVKRLVREAGGVPFIFNTIGVDDGIAMGHGGMKYSLPSRELIADCVETMLRAHCFDGMVCIPNCDKIVPGMLMASMRLNIPTVFVSGGPMAAGVAQQATEGDLPAHLQPAVQKTDLISVFKGVGELQAGKITAEDLQKLEQSACPTCGSCSGMFTANSMNCLCEALGMALPGQRHHPRRLQGARRALRARRPRHHQTGRSGPQAPRHCVTLGSLRQRHRPRHGHGGQDQYRSCMHWRWPIEAGVPSQPRPPERVLRAHAARAQGPRSSGVRSHGRCGSRAGGIILLFLKDYLKEAGHSQTPGLQFTVTGKTPRRHIACFQRQSVQRCGLVYPLSRKRLLPQTGGLAILFGQPGSRAAA